MPAILADGAAPAQPATRVGPLADGIRPQTGPPRAKRRLGRGWDRWRTAYVRKQAHERPIGSTLLGGRGGREEGGRLALQVVETGHRGLCSDLLHDRHQRAGADAAVVAHPPGVAAGQDVADASVLDGVGEPLRGDLGLTAREAAEAG